jgi:hypothetical protein
MIPEQRKKLGAMAQALVEKLIAKKPTSMAIVHSDR